MCNDWVKIFWSCDGWHPHIKASPTPCAVTAGGSVRTARPIEELPLGDERALHVDEKLRRDLPDGSARVKIIGAPGAYTVDWWSPEPSNDWEPVERGEFDDIEEPDDVSHLA